jgi:hypothetical protein
MAESKPLISEIRASIEFTIVGGTSVTAFAVSGRAAETPKLDSVPIKKFPIFFMAYNINTHYITMIQEEM